jgi:ABC-type transport system involved in cytochrome c biogenesis permease subunit
MLQLIGLFEILLPFLYFGTIWMYARAFFSNIRLAERLRTPFLFATLLTHGAYIAVRTTELRHPPITSVFEILTLIAFTVTLVYSYIELRLRIKSTGYFILIFPFFFQLVSSILIKQVTEVPPILRSNLLGIHVSSALLGYAAITISAVYGFLYLMLYHDIKSSQFGVIYQRLPNLETLERMSFTATVFGFILLTIAIVVGLIWIPRLSGGVSYTDPKLFGTSAIWLIYAVGLTAKRAKHWQGRRMMVLSMFGFATAMFSMTIINVFLSSFHKFY